MPEAKIADPYVAPLKEDLEELLSRFQQIESVRFEHFSAIWRDMKFSTIHHGLPLGTEARPFSRLALTSAYVYLLPPHNFQMRVGGLYLLYGLYTTQLAWPRVGISVALKDWDDLQAFIQSAWEGRHLDVIYIYWRLVSMKAFLYSAMPVSLTYERRRAISKHRDQDLPTERPERVKTFVLSNTTRELKQIQDRYEKMKANLSLTSTLRATRQDITKLMLDYVQELEPGECSEKVVASEAGAESAEISDREDSLKRAELLASIKSKSFELVTKASKSRRHRQVECEVTSTTSPDPYTDQLIRKKKRPPSLRSRICQAFGEDKRDDPKQHWLLSAAVYDRKCLKRKSTKPNFKWQ